ncbi:MAG: hypothetical protein PHV33_07425 [Elusimicrobiales bacterium]|nr:hypothetical protein [Elusimicrobiales bacterium]
MKKVIILMILAMAAGVANAGSLENAAAEASLAKVNLSQARVVEVPIPAMEKVDYPSPRELIVMVNGMELMAPKTNSDPFLFEILARKEKSTGVANKVGTAALDWFLLNDTKIGLETNEAGDSWAEVLVRHATWSAGDNWIAVKKYPLDGVPDSPQALDSATKYAMERLKMDTTIKVRKISGPVCGGEGPAYIAEIRVAAVMKSVKTYAIQASELSTLSGTMPAFMDEDSCRE